MAMRNSESANGIVVEPGQYVIKVSSGGTPVKCLVRKVMIRGVGPDKSHNGRDYRQVTRVHLMFMEGPMHKYGHKLYAKSAGDLWVLED